MRITLTNKELTAALTAWVELNLETLAHRGGKISKIDVGFNPPTATVDIDFVLTWLPAPPATIPTEGA